MITLVTPDTAEEKDDTEQIEVFSIDGKVYSIPNKVVPGIGRRLIYMARTEGVPQAEDWLGRAMLGNDGWLALINFPAITDEDIQRVLVVARSVAMGEYQPAPKEPRPEVESSTSPSRAPKSSGTKSKS